MEIVTVFPILPEMLPEYADHVALEMNVGMARSASAPKVSPGTVHADNAQSVPSPMPMAQNVSAQGIKYSQLIGLPVWHARQTRSLRLI